MIDYEQINLSLRIRFDRNKLKIVKGSLLFMLLISLVTLVTAYYDTDFYFLDYASGYFYGVVGTFGLLMLIALRRL